jgi:branched-chain amino acid transport system substrate-binding protein
MMVQIAKDGFKVVGECTGVDSAYLDPTIAQEKRLGIGK